MYELNISFGTSEFLLKKLKDALKAKKKLTDEEQLIGQLVNTIAVEKGYTDIYPYLTVTFIGDIVEDVHLKFKLIKIEEINVEEGSMSMEFTTLIVFQNRGDRTKLLGVEIETNGPVNGEMWSDWVDNYADDLYPIFEVVEDKKIVYKKK